MNKRQKSQNKMAVSIDSGPVYHRSGKERNRQEVTPASLQEAVLDDLQQKQGKTSPETVGKMKINWTESPREQRHKVNRKRKNKQLRKTGKASTWRKQEHEATTGIAWQCKKEESTTMQEPANPRQCTSPESKRTNTNPRQCKKEDEIYNFRKRKWHLATNCLWREVKGSPYATPTLFTILHSSIDIHAISWINRHHSAAQSNRNCLLIS